MSTISNDLIFNSFLVKMIDRKLNNLVFILICVIKFLQPSTAALGKNGSGRD